MLAVLVFRAFWNNSKALFYLGGASRRELNPPPYGRGRWPLAPKAVTLELYPFTTPSFNE